MACITKHYLDEYSILGVWKIEEDIETLLKMIVLDNDEKKKFKGFSSNSRKLEFLSVRALLADLIGSEAKRYHLYIHWCAKEALYKICDKEGINFKKNLTISPFQVEDAGEIKGFVHTDKINEEFDLHYSRYDNYAIVWTKKKL